MKRLLQRDYGNLEAGDCTPMRLDVSCKDRVDGEENFRVGNENNS